MNCRRGLAKALILVAVVLICVGCGGGGSIGDPSAGGDPGAGGGPGGDPGAGGGPGGDPGAGGGSQGGIAQLKKSKEYEDYVKRCQQATRDFTRANVVYDPQMRMQRGIASTVTGIVTLDTTIPPG
jgi:hypothetical protein